MYSSTEIRNGSFLRLFYSDMNENTVAYFQGVGLLMLAFASTLNPQNHPLFTNNRDSTSVFSYNDIIAISITDLFVISLLMKYQLIYIAVCNNAIVQQ